MTPCRCSDVPFLWAAEADAYAGAHLVREEVRDDGTVLLRCMGSGRGWLQDHPLDDAGVPTLRLRWADLSPADVAAYLASGPGLEEFLLTMDPDVEHQPLPHAPVLQGLPALRDYAEAHLRAEHAPRTTAMSVLERDHDAVVLGHVSLNRDGRYVEHRPAAWILTVRDARVVRVRAFDDWGRAREAAGVAGGDVPERRLGSALLRFLAAQAPRPAYRL